MEDELETHLDLYDSLKETIMGKPHGTSCNVLDCTSAVTVV